MIVNLNLDTNRCTVTREADDKKFYNESTLLHHVKLALIEQGHDAIKKRMWKDGHLVDSEQQYIRTRRGYEPSFCIYDNHYAIRRLDKTYNEDGEVVLVVVTDIWESE